MLSLDFQVFDADAAFSLMSFSRIPMNVCSEKCRSPPPNDESEFGAAKLETPAQLSLLMDYSALTRIPGKNYLVVSLVMKDGLVPSQHSCGRYLAQNEQ